MATYYASSSYETINGTEAADFIYGGSESHSGTFYWLNLYGNDGDDTINAENTEATDVYGGSGNDILLAGTSIGTYFWGGDGNDTIYGESADTNFFFAEAGDDVIYAGNATNSLFFGGDGHNVFYGGVSAGSVSYGAGNGGDEIHAGDVTDLSKFFVAYGGNGADTFFGESVQGNIKFYGGAGDDVYFGGFAKNILISDSSDTDALFLNYSYSAYTFTVDENGNVVGMVDEGADQAITFSGIEDFYFNNGSGGWDHYTYAELACFLAGTRIRTAQGEVPVETLKAGDLVLTTTGEAKPVLWLGRRAVTTRFAHPLTALPIHIRPDALGHGMPVRDLFVSPDHAFFMGGLLVQAGALVNGTTITRHHDLPEIFTYYHVELEDHDLIYAEGLPAETFIDNLERETFDNVADFPGRSRPAVELDLPRVKSRRQLPKGLARALETWAQQAVSRVA